MATKVSLPPPSGGYQVAGNPPSSAYDGYKQSTNNFTRPPDYPDTSYGRYLKSGGSFPGFGYYAWRDKLVNDYNTAYELYTNWYNSAGQQVSRLNDAGLNTNLAYGQVSPGGASFSPRSASPSPDIAGVIGTGAQVLAGVVGNIKTLAETATLVTALPQSRFKSRLAKQLDVAAAAGAINSEHGYMQQLNTARQVLGVGSSKASAEKANAAYQAAMDSANEQTLDYMMSHGFDGSESDFEGSLFLEGKTSAAQADILAYKNNKAQFDNLFSKPEYWKAQLDKMVADATITQAEASTASLILSDKEMDPWSKMLALQGGIPGFLAKLAFSMTRNIKASPFGKNPVFESGKIIGGKVKTWWQSLGEAARKSNKGKSPRQASKGVKNRDYPSNIYNH